MKQLRKTVCLLPIVALVIGLLGACGKKDLDVTCPFTEVTWENSIADIQELGGKLNTEVDSEYNGDTYEVETSYLGYDGVVHYMFDDKDKLVNMTWIYTGGSTADIQKLCSDLVKITEETHGKSGYDYELGTNAGYVWYSDKGNVILSYFATDELKMLQYSYKHPDVSLDE